MAHSRPFRLASRPGASPHPGRSSHWWRGWGWSAVLVALAGLPGEAAALDVRQQPFAVRKVEGLDAVDALAQGRNGLLWFASRTGLTRFDGDRLVEIDLGPTDPRSGRWVRRVLATRDAAIWAAAGVGQ